jgi:hypothetical protein
MYFADDVSSDGIFDIGAARMYARLPLPCEKQLFAINLSSLIKKQ